MGAERYQLAVSWSLVSHQWEPITAGAQGWRVACRSASAALFRCFSEPASGEELGSECYQR